MKRPKVLFFCGHESPYGKAHLEPILGAPFDLVAVVLADDGRWSLFRESLQGKTYVSFPPSPIKRITSFRKRYKLKSRSRKYKLSLEKLCAESHVPVWWLHDVNDSAFLEKLRDLQIDWLISAAYPQIFKSPLLSIPASGSINFHPSLLPKFRGAHPHFWAIATGAHETGVTAHILTEKIDEGDIIAQIPIPIDGLNYHELYSRLVAETPGLVEQVARFCVSGNNTARPQDTEAATYFRNDREIHHRVFWDEANTQQIINLIRTGTAYCYFRDRRVRILDAYATETNRNLTNDVRVSPGTIVDFYKDALVVKTVNGCINIRQLTCTKKPLKFNKWITKLKAQVGERFM